jgi:gas vesicle protein GvpG
MVLLTLPLRGLLWIFEEIVTRAENTRHDEDGLRAELLQLYQAMESGTLSEAEFTEREEELAHRLAEAEEWHREHDEGRESSP